MPPTPNIQSTRLVGIELEFDSCGTQYREPRGGTPRGWEKKTDGSLRNGYEYVMNPPVCIRDVNPVIERFSTAFLEAKTNLGKRGGFHVHVSAPDYDIGPDCFKLAQFYSKFQGVINSLLAASRHNNSFCPPYPSRITEASVTQMFNLNQPAQNRYMAKCSRAYSVVNMAMMRAAQPNDRTVEFRQGSPSKRFENIQGWAAFTVFCTDIVKLPQVLTYCYNLPGPDNLEKLLKVAYRYEEATGSSNMAAWIKWRHDYMNQAPDADLITRAVQSLGGGTHGIFHVARALNVNNGVALKVLQAALSQGRISSAPATGDGPRFRVNFSQMVEQDLAELRAIYQGTSLAPQESPPTQAAVGA